MTDIRYANHLAFIAHKPKRRMWNEAVRQLDPPRTGIKAIEECIEVVVLECERKRN